MRIEKMLLLVPALVLALTVHEFAHAWAARRLGDDTAQKAGRLTLNPLAHLDPLGTLVLFLSQTFGWARPVPVNPGLFRRPARDMALTALAGPAMNFLVAVVLVPTWAYLLWLPHAPFLQALFLEGTSVPFLILIDIFSLIARISISINLNLAFFNLLPLPPLDGFQVLAPFMPAGMTAFFKARPVQLILLGLLLFLIYTGVIGKILYHLDFYFLLFFYIITP